MRLSELAAAISARHKLTGAELDAWMDDLRQTGVKDGPALQDAFNAWRGEWKYQRAPRPPEFASYYHVNKSDKQIDGVNRRWIELRKPAMGFARDYLIHADLIEEDALRVVIRPLSAYCRQWWAIPGKREEVARLIGREVVIQ